MTSIWLLVLWAGLTLLFLGMPFAFAQSGPATATSGLTEGCEVIYLNDFFYRPFRINVVHDLGSSTVQRIYDDESTQQITLLEPLKEPGEETTNIGFESNSTGHMIAKLSIEHQVEKTKPRKLVINYQSAGQEMIRSTLEYTGTQYCRVFEITATEQVLPLTNQQVLDLGNQITEAKFEAVIEAVSDNTGSTNQGNLINGIVGASVALIGVLIWRYRKQFGNIISNVIDDYKLMRQEYANMIQANAVEEMHRNLEYVNFENNLKNAVQYFNTAAEKKLDELKFIIDKLLATAKPVESIVQTDEPEQIEKPTLPKIITTKLKGILPKSEKKTSTAGEEFRKEILDKIKDMEASEQDKFLNETYTNLYPPTHEELLNISPELNERLYIIKHIMREIRSSEYE